MNNITAQDDYLKVKIEITDDRINRGNARHKSLNYRGRSQKYVLYDDLSKLTG